MSKEKLYYLLFSQTYQIKAIIFLGFGKLGKGDSDWLYTYKGISKNIKELSAVGVGVVSGGIDGIVREKALMVIANGHIWRYSLTRNFTCLESSKSIMR